MLLIAAIHNKCDCTSLCAPIPLDLPHCSDPTQQTPATLISPGSPHSTLSFSLFLFCLLLAAAGILGIRGSVNMLCQQVLISPVSIHNKIETTIFRRQIKKENSVIIIFILNKGLIHMGTVVHSA